jgi:hypothetical protein
MATNIHYSECEKSTHDTGEQSGAPDIFSAGYLFFIAPRAGAFSHRLMATAGMSTDI